MGFRPSQTFSLDNKLRKLAVRKDVVRDYYYIHLPDIHMCFPYAVRFKVQGADVSFLQDERNKCIEPKRIGHYPNTVIEIVTSEKDAESIIPTNSFEMRATVVSAPLMLQDSTGSSPARDCLVRGVSSKTTKAASQSAPVVRSVSTKSRRSKKLMNLTEPGPPQQTLAPSQQKQQQQQPVQQTHTASRTRLKSPTQRQVFRGSNKEDSSTPSLRSLPTETTPRMTSRSIATSTTERSLRQRPRKSRSERNMAKHRGSKERRQQRSSNISPSPGALQTSSIMLDKGPEELTLSCPPVQLSPSHSLSTPSSYIDSSFLEWLQESGGEYDTNRRSIAIQLMSESMTEEFLEHLIAGDSVVQELDLKLGWEFTIQDITQLVDDLYDTAIRRMHLDLLELGEGWDQPKQTRTVEDLYQALYGLLFHRTLRSLVLTNASHFGPRTSDIDPSEGLSCLQSFHFVNEVTLQDQSRIANILACCPNLIDLRLGSLTGDHSTIYSTLDRAIGSLQKLQSLHLCRINIWPAVDFEDSQHTSTTYCSDKLKDIVRIGTTFGHHPLDVVTRRQAAVLRVLILWGDLDQDHVISLTPLSSNNADAGTATSGAVFMKSSSKHDQPSFSSLQDPRAFDLQFSRLTHLDLAADLTATSHELLSAVLPKLNLIHFGASHRTRSLLKHVNFASLKSIWLVRMQESDLQPMFDTILGNSHNACPIETMRLDGITEVEDLPMLLEALSLKRLHLLDLKYNALREILKVVDLKQLQVLGIHDLEYDWKTEATLARRKAEFTRNLVVQLGYDHAFGMLDIHDIEARDMCDSLTMLGQYRVQVLESKELDDWFIQAILPKYSF
ncbi:hypothetical protein EC991_006934 [Linnemannia zychae]|nr:hypothetical protein EC991_006934 [Linnemannia zychae]